MTVRAILSLPIIKTLYTRSIDITLAFRQTPVKPTIYMYSPLGETST